MDAKYYNGGPEDIPWPSVEDENEDGDDVPHHRDPAAQRPSPGDAADEHHELPPF
jgi:hypothetical protein